MKKLENNYIYIFGEKSVRAYAEMGDMVEVKEIIEAGDGKIYVHPSNGCPNKLLDAFMGWGDYIEISPPEYEEYMKIDFTEEDLGIGCEF